MPIVDLQVYHLGDPAEVAVARNEPQPMPQRGRGDPEIILGEASVPKGGTSAFGAFAGSSTVENAELDRREPVGHIVVDAEYRDGPKEPEDV